MIVYKGPADAQLAGTHGCSVWVLVFILCYAVIGFIYYIGRVVLGE